MARFLALAVAALIVFAVIGKANGTPAAQGVQGWLPWRWKRQYVDPVNALEFVVVFDQETTPHAMLGTGTPPIRTFDLFPRGGTMPLALTVTPTGLGIETGQMVMTPLDGAPQ